MSPTRRAILAASLVFSLSLVPVLDGCNLTPKQQHDVVDFGLTLAQISCIFATSFTDEQAVLEVCKIEGKLAPFVRELIGQREAAKRAGVSWKPTMLDAGADAAKDAGTQ